jgi:uncharacterized protein YuzE
MNISYDDQTNLLYIRIDSTKQEVLNQQVSEDVVFDIGVNNRIVGIEIMNASEHIDLEKILPIKKEVVHARA